MGRRLVQITILVTLALPAHAGWFGEDREEYVTKCVGEGVLSGESVSRSKHDCEHAWRERERNHEIWRDYMRQQGR